MIVLWVVFAVVLLFSIIATALYFMNGGSVSSDSSGGSVPDPVEGAVLAYTPSTLEVTGSTATRWLTLPSSDQSVPMVFIGEPSLTVPTNANYQGFTGFVSTTTQGAPSDIQLGGFNPFTVAYTVKGTDSVFSVYGYYSLRVVLNGTTATVKMNSRDGTTIIGNLEVADTEWFQLIYTYDGILLKVYTLENGSFPVLVAVSDAITPIQNTPPGAEFGIETGGSAILTCYIFDSVINPSDMSPIFDTFVNGDGAEPEKSGGSSLWLYSMIGGYIVSVVMLIVSVYYQTKGGSSFGGSSFSSSF